MLEVTKRLFARPADTSNPVGLLTNVLKASVELVSLDGNDFAWSSWQDRGAAVSELHGLLAKIENEIIPPHLTVSVLFAPTGPMQELSMSSGWADTFLRLATYFDAVEAALWPCQQ